MTTLLQVNSEMLTMTDPYKFRDATQYKTVSIFRFSVQFWIRIYIESAPYAVITRFSYIGKRIVKPTSTAQLCLTVGYCITDFRSGASN